MALEPLLPVAFPDKSIDAIVNFLQDFLDTEQASEEECTLALRFSMTCLLEWYRYLLVSGKLFQDSCLCDGVLAAIEPSLLKTDLIDIRNAKRILELLSERMWMNLKSTLSNDEVVYMVKGLVMKALDLSKRLFQDVGAPKPVLH